MIFIQYHWIQYVVFLFLWFYFLLLCCRFRGGAGSTTTHEQKNPTQTPLRKFAAQWNLQMFGLNYGGISNGLSGSDPMRPWAWVIGLDSAAFKIFLEETERKRVQENGQEILYVFESVSELLNEFENQAKRAQSKSALELLSFWDKFVLSWILIHL